MDESHVWHMHGHSFHVMAHSTSTQLRGIARTHEALKDIAKKMVQRSDTPPLKDNVVVPKGGLVVLQFQAKNPGKNGYLFILQLAVPQRFAPGNT